LKFNPEKERKGRREPGLGKQNLSPTSLQIEPCDQKIMIQNPLIAIEKEELTCKLCYRAYSVLPFDAMYPTTMI